MLLNYPEQTVIRMYGNVPCEQRFAVGRVDCARLLNVLFLIPSRIRCYNKLH